MKNWKELLQILITYLGNIVLKINLEYFVSVKLSQVSLHPMSLMRIGNSQQ